MGYYNISTRNHCLLLVLHSSCERSCQPLGPDGVHKTREGKEQWKNLEESPRLDILPCAHRKLLLVWVTLAALLVEESFGCSANTTSEAPVKNFGTADALSSFLDQGSWEGY